MSIRDKYKEQMARFKDSVKKAADWLNTKLKTITGNELLADRERLVSRGQLNNKMIGRMMMYYYDPKGKVTLPYYDRFPLTIVVKLNRNGFLGLNLHYLPPELRVRLLDGLYRIYKTKHMDENRKLNLSYQLLKSSSKTRFFAPCLKQYLYSHCKSKFYVVDPEEWNQVLLLPLERFAKKDKQYVWNESRKQLNIRN